MPENIRKKTNKITQKNTLTHIHTNKKNEQHAEKGGFCLFLDMENIKRHTTPTK